MTYKAPHHAFISNINTHHIKQMCMPVSLHLTLCATVRFPILHIYYFMHLSRRVVIQNKEAKKKTHKNYRIRREKKFVEQIRKLIHHTIHFEMKLFLSLGHLIIQNSIFNSSTFYFFSSILLTLRAIYILFYKNE